MEEKWQGTRQKKYETKVARELVKKVCKKRSK